MSEPLGQLALRRTADFFELDPGSWSKDRGTGSFGSAIDETPERLAERLCKPGEDGCIDYAIRCQSKLIAGEKWHKVAKQARKILCRHHGLHFGRVSIFNYNDYRCKTVQDAIDFLRAPLHAAAPKPKESAARELQDA